MNPKKFQIIFLFVLLTLSLIACQTISGIGQRIKNTQATAASVVTEVQSFATEGSKLVGTVQSFATENPSIANTAKAVLTQVPDLLKTGQTIATENPGIVQTAQSIITQAPDLIETAKAYATENPQLVGTAEAFATENPGVVETAKAIATQGLNLGSKPEDIPLLPEDQMNNVFSTQNMVSYSTETSYAEVVDFYKREMLTNGWTAESKGNIEMDSMVVLNYQKDNSKAIVTISINPADKNTLVLVVVR